MRTRAGQITIEYFLLLAAIIIVTVIANVTFHTDIRDTFKNLFFKARGSMPLNDLGPQGQDAGGIQGGAANGGSWSRGGQVDD